MGVVVINGAGQSGSSSTYTPPNCIVGPGTDPITSSSPHAAIGRFYDYTVNLGSNGYFDWVIRYDGSGYMESGSTGGAHPNLSGAQAGPDGQVSITGSTLVNGSVVTLWGSNAGPQFGEWCHQGRNYAWDGGANLWVDDTVNGLIVGKCKIGGANSLRTTPGVGGGSDQVWYFHSDHQNGTGALALARRFETLAPFGLFGIGVNFVPQRPLGLTFSGASTLRANGYWKFDGTSSSFPDQSDGFEGGLYKPFFTSTEQTGTGSAQNIAHDLGATPDKVVVTITDDTSGAFTVTEGTHTSSNIVVTVTTGRKYKVFAYRNYYKAKHNATKGNGKADFRAGGWPVPASTYDADCPVDKVGDILIPNGHFVPPAPALPGQPLFFDDFIRGDALTVADGLAGKGQQDYYRYPKSGPNIGATRNDGSLGSLTWNQTMSTSNGWDYVTGRSGAIQYLGNFAALRSYAVQPCLFWVDSGTADHTVVVERIEATGSRNAGLDQTAAVVRMGDNNNFIVVYNFAGSANLQLWDYQSGGNVNGFNVGAAPTNTSWTKMLVKCIGNIIRVYVNSASGVLLNDGNGNPIPNSTSNKWELLTWSGPSGGGWGGGTDYPDIVHNAATKCGTSNAGNAGVAGHGCFNCKTVAGYRS